MNHNISITGHLALSRRIFVRRIERISEWES